MVWKDPIVEEMHQVRTEIMNEHDNDLHKLFEHLRQRQQAGERKIVSPPHKQTDSTLLHPE